MKKTLSSSLWSLAKSVVEKVTEHKANGKLTRTRALYVKTEVTNFEYDKLNRLTERLASESNRIFQELGVEAQITCGGSLFNIHFTGGKILNIRDSNKGNMDLRRDLFFAMLNPGIYVALRGYGCLSTPMTDREVDTFLDTLRAALVEDLNF